MTSQPQTLSFFYQPSDRLAVAWKRKIEKWIKKKYPKVKTVLKNGQVVIVLGGDGTILQAARQHHNFSNASIVGLNLGHVGFLASVRQPKNFLTSLDKFFKGKYWIAERMMLTAKVIRNKRSVFSAEALNEIVVQNILGLVEVSINIEGNPIQYVRGSGVLVGTATGSTGFNLSAHGPIVMPDIKCLIVTELMDHNIPTPSIVLKYTKKIVLKIKDFRKKGLLSITENKKTVDVLLIADGENIFPLEKKDTIVIKASSHLIKFVEFEKNYFFKSLQEKFSFK